MGLNVTLRVWVPAVRIAPAAGEYVKVPGIVAPLYVAVALS
jgi:hypothetical protein